jgi:hypothetical protein
VVEPQRLRHVAGEPREVLDEEDLEGTVGGEGGGEEPLVAGPLLDAEAG